MDLSPVNLPGHIARPRRVFILLDLPHIHTKAMIMHTKALIMHTKALIMIILKAI